MVSFHGIYVVFNFRDCIFNNLSLHWICTVHDRRDCIQNNGVLVWDLYCTWCERLYSSQWCPCMESVLYMIWETYSKQWSPYMESVNLLYRLWETMFSLHEICTVHDMRDCVLTNGSLAWGLYCMWSGSLYTKQWCLCMESALYVIWELVY